MYLSFFTVGQQPTQQKLKWQNNILQKVTTISTKKAPVVRTPASHRYPVASNGKLLDVAVIGESAQSTQVSTQKPQSDSDVKVLGVTKQTQRKVMGKDRGLLECPKCSSRHASDPRWVYCPKCFVVIHKTCLLISGCICKYRLTQWTFSFLSSRVRLVYKLSVPQKWGLVIELFYKVLQDCRFLKSEAWCFYFKSQLWLWYCFLYEWLILLLTIQIYNKDFSHKLYFFMFFVATKMGSHCKETQNHGKQRCVKMTHF